MRWIPAGSFLMGSSDYHPEERPEREATVSGFWIDRDPVTVREFRAFVETTGYVTVAERGAAIPGPLVFRPAVRPSSVFEFSACWRIDRHGAWTTPGGIGSSVLGCEDDPVVQVTHEDAAAYARWAGKSLPTEVEWERAARGGLRAKTYAWGDELSPRRRPHANVWQGDFPWQNLLTDGYFWTSPVGAFPANGYGLHDMIGNVWEWTDDSFRPSPEFAPPCCVGLDHAWETESVDLKVIKGGSFLCSEGCCHYRPAARCGQHAATAACHLGFRCVVRTGDLTEGS